MPRNIRTRPTRQKYHAPPKVLRRPPPPRRYPSTNARHPLPIIHQRLVHVRRDIPRRDGIDRDAALGPAVREALGQLPHGALARGVGGHVQPALERQQRGEVDHAAPPACHFRGRQGEHVRAGVAAEREHGGEVHLQHGGEVGVGKGFAGVSDLDPGAVHEDAEGVPVCEDGGDEGRDGGGGGQVGGVDLGFAAEGFDRFLRFGGGCVALGWVLVGSSF